MKLTYELLYPTLTETGGRARVCLFVSKKIAAGCIYPAYSRDCQEVRIKTETMELRLFNIYNEQQRWGALDQLAGLLPTV